MLLGYVSNGRADADNEYWIETSMKEKTKQDLVQFLKKSMDVFAWSHEDMHGIDPNVITYRLNMSLS